MFVISEIIAPSTAPQRLGGHEGNPRAIEILAALRQHGGRPVKLWSFLDGLAKA